MSDAKETDPDLHLVFYSRGKFYQWPFFEMPDEMVSDCKPEADRVLDNGTLFNVAFWKRIRVK